MSSNVGDIFQDETKYSRGNVPTSPLDYSSQPETYKSYPECKLIDLPEPRPASTMSLSKALARRKSVREYSKTQLTIQELSYLLWATDGVSHSGHGYEFRTAPSAGALYPVETYIVANRFSDLPQGVYHYSVKKHALEEIDEGDYSERIASAALDQPMCAGAPVVFIWTAVFERAKWKYKQRAYRYVYLDAGHMAGNLALAAASMGLGSCQVAALYDEEVNKILGVDGADESVIYMSVVGHGAKD